MKPIMCLALLTAFAVVVVSMPLPQNCNSATIRRADPTSMTIGQIVASKSCPPASLMVKVANSHHESIQGLGSFFSDAWDSVSNAVTSIIDGIPQAIHDEVFNTPLGFDILADWLSKMRDLWTIDKNPADPSGKSLKLTPPASKPGLQPTYWTAPWGARGPIKSPGSKCGLGTNKLCP